jgi:hypothetical protein
MRGRARGPKRSKLAACARLREVVEEKLGERPFVDDRAELARLYRR